MLLFKKKLDRSSRYILRPHIPMGYRYGSLIGLIILIIDILAIVAIFKSSRDTMSKLLWTLLILLFPLGGLLIYYFFGRKA
jgi:uncharacterized membrane protein